MKRNLIAMLSLIACFTTYAQEEIGTELRAKEKQQTTTSPQSVSPTITPTKEVRRNKTITISKRAGQPQVVHNAAYYQNEISIIDTNLSAIDQKVAYINANAQEKQKAEENGWFQDMEKIKTDLILKKKTLQEKLSNL